MKVTDVVSGVDKKLGYLCLRRTTADDVDKTLEITQCFRPSQVNEGEYSWLVILGSIIIMVNVFCSNVAIKHFSSNISCQLHRFYLTKIITKNRLELYVNSESVDDETGDNLINVLHQ